MQKQFLIQQVQDQMAALQELLIQINNGADNIIGEDAESVAEKIEEVRAELQETVSAVEEFIDSDDSDALEGREYMRDGED